MTMPAALERLIVVPRNGYANRLQAWASAAILAAQLDIPLSVLWEPEEIAPAAASDLFSPALINRALISAEDVVAAVGARHQDLPRYLSVTPDGRTVVLAGHDRGEQAFMHELDTTVRTSTHAKTLVIIAGGTFHLPSDEVFLRQRTIFYRTLGWSAELDARLARALHDRPAFGGLHIRQTDRSLEAPTRRAIRSGLERLHTEVEGTSLFIAADSAAGRDLWSQEAAGLGFAPWSAADIDFDRTSTAAGIDALTDWRLLSSAEAIVYPSASTFSREAAVASGHAERAIPLTATAARQRARSLSALGRSALTYPARRLTRSSG